MTPARCIASMLTIPGRTLGALFLSALVAGAAPAEAGLRRECRKQCGAAVSACVTSTGQAARICKAQVRRRCRQEGLQVCAGTAIAPMFDDGTGTACTPTPSSISSNFNGTPIAAGNFIWFNSVLKVSGLSSTQTANIHFTNQRITFSAPGGPYTLPVPDATVTFCPNCSPAMTTFSGTWMTSVPSSLAGGQNSFLSGLAFQVPTNFPGGIKPVTWSGTFSSTSLPGVTVSWKWGAAVYTSFDGSMVNLGVKPTDKPTSVYKNSDHAGTPENFKKFVTGGATGGGGANFTGGNSGTGSVTCPACTPNCSHKNCGADGCGGSCGTCSMSDCDMTTGMCVGCIPSGDQGCRGDSDCCSGVCGAGTVCETTTTTTTTTTSTTTTTQCTAPDPCDDSTCGPTPDSCGATVACPCAQCQFECTDHLQHRSPACAAPAACTADSCLLDCATACSAIDRVCFPETVQCVSCTP